MLRELRIKNFAIIDQATLELGPGLNVLTGETGAGKTIILNALGLILGGRISSDFIRQGEQEATVEALLDDLPQPLRDKLREMDYGDEDELIIKRVVSRQGKNRIYLNGSLAPLVRLAELGSHLIHIYGQHEHHGLLNPERHLPLLDAYGSLEDKATAVGRRYHECKTLWDQLNRAKETLARQVREEAMLREQVDEISRASLQSGEEEELQARKNILNHAEKLFSGCQEGEEVLYEAEDSVVSRLGRVLARLQELAAIDPSLDETVELVNSAMAHLDEATSSLRQYKSRVEFDPQALERLDDRMAELNRLKRKYNESIEEIIKIGENAAEVLNTLDRGEEGITALEKEVEKSRRIAWTEAEALSAQRKRAAKGFKKDLEKETDGLGMASTQFEIRFLDGNSERDGSPFSNGQKTLTEDGMDQVELYFSPNPGEDVKPLARIASGGELSRVMLAIKSLVLTKGEIPTLLFDEVDAGIGGRVAEMVGNKLKKVAETHQVLCVTHLPQVAALASSHYVVEKEVSKGRTFTRVKKLAQKEKIAEIARMLGGIKITEQTKRHAEEMLKGA